MHVALFGGSFNPPHIGHQLAALYVLQTEDVDELWFLPCFMHPFAKDLVSFDERLAMCALAVRALGGHVKASDFERRLGGESRTLRTVQGLADAHPGDTFSWVVGSDLEAETATWYGAEELRRSVPFIVVGRAGAEGGRPVAMPGISSSDVRDRLQRGQSVQAMVPRVVLDYIRQRKLYGGCTQP